MASGGEGGVWLVRAGRAEGGWPALIPVRSTVPQVRNLLHTSDLISFESLVAFFHGSAVFKWSPDPA